MNAEELRALLEQEITWRMDELRVLRNSLTDAGIAETSPHYRRVLIVMTYAHFEGFVKQALGNYADHINRTRTKCGDLLEAISASTMASEFRSLRQPVANDDASVRGFEVKRLRQAERETGFIGSIRQLDAREVALPVDEVVALEFNLNYDILQRVLYRLGLDSSAFETDANAVEFLVRTRNEIAHGGRSDAIPDGQFRAAMSKTPVIMGSLARLLYDAARDAKYRRKLAVG